MIDEAPRKKRRTGELVPTGKELFHAVEQRLRRVPNMLRLMANAPPVPGAYLQCVLGHDARRSRYLAASFI